MLSSMVVGSRWMMRSTTGGDIGWTCRGPRVTIPSRSARTGWAAAGRDRRAANSAHCWGVAPLPEGRETRVPQDHPRQQEHHEDDRQEGRDRHEQASNDVLGHVSVSHAVRAGIGTPPLTGGVPDVARSARFMRRRTLRMRGRPACWRTRRAPAGVSGSRRRRAGQYSKAPVRPTWSGLMASHWAAY